MACIRIGVLALSAAWFVSTQVADAQAARSDCFHVTVANQGGVPNSAIRWNSCTGETWLLLRSPDTDKDGKPNGSTYGWFPVIVTKALATSVN